MNSEFQNFQNRMMADAASIMGEAFTYQGQTYQGIVSSRKLEYQAEDGGYIQTLQIIIVVSKAQLSTTPVSGQTLVYNGTTIRIESVADDFAAWEVTGITATK